MAGSTGGGTTTTTTTTAVSSNTTAMVQIVNPRRQSFGMALDQVIDRLVQEINTAFKKLTISQSSSTNALTSSVMNNSVSQIAQYLIYGLSAGLMTPAHAGNAAVEPVFQALGSAGIGNAFSVCVVGPSSVLLANPSEAITAGAWGWLSSTVPGKVTSIEPTEGRRYRVCQFANTKVTSSGLVSAYLFLFPQGATTL